MQSGGGLTIFHGTKDTLICGCYGQNPWLLSGRVPNAPKVDVYKRQEEYRRGCRVAALMPRDMLGDAATLGNGTDTCKARVITVSYTHLARRSAGS